MKFISPKLHGVIDYLVVIFLLASPSIFYFTGLLAWFTYVLGAVHFMLTLLTNFSGGLFRIIPFPIHGLIELVVGIALVVVSYTLFKDSESGKLFYTAFGVAVLLVWFVTDYKGATAI